MDINPNTYDMDIKGLNPEMNNLISLHMGLDGYNMSNTMILLKNPQRDDDDETKLRQHISDNDQDLGVPIKKEELQKGFNYFRETLRNFTMIRKTETWPKGTTPSRPPDFLYVNKWDSVTKELKSERTYKLDTGKNDVIGVGWTDVSSGGEYELLLDNTVSNYKNDLADIVGPQRVIKAFNGFSSNGMDFNIHAHDFYAFLLNIYIIDQTHDFRDYRMRSRQGGGYPQNLIIEDVQKFWMRTLFIIGGGLEIVSKLKPDSDSKVLEKAHEGLKTIIKTIRCEANNQQENLLLRELLGMNLDHPPDNTGRQIKNFHEGLMNAITTEDKEKIFNYVVDSKFLEGFSAAMPGQETSRSKRRTKKKPENPDWAPLTWLNEIEEYIQSLQGQIQEQDRILNGWWQLFEPGYNEKKVKLPRIMKIFKVTKVKEMKLLKTLWTHFIISNQQL